MDPKDEGSLYLLIGGMKADLAHILSAVTQSRKDLLHLEDRVSTDIKGLGERLTVVERFNWKVLGVASVAVPALVIGINILLKYAQIL